MNENEEYFEDENIEELEDEDYEWTLADIINDEIKMGMRE